MFEWFFIRQNRLGRYGPFDKSKKGNNYQDVSDLAPAWMHIDGVRSKSTTFSNTKPPPNLRNEQKRIFLVENEQPKRSVFSFGDFRHNVHSSQEVVNYSKDLMEKPYRLIEWNEDVPKQRYDKPVTMKIGYTSQ